MRTKASMTKKKVKNILQPYLMKPKAQQTVITKIQAQIK